ncbi:hypothetical protein KC361_g174 [Hortaea werneckii]|nr:hypothetical protein KC361_g174 [Hortaea werneckii]
MGVAGLATMNQIHNSVVEHIFAQAHWRRWYAARPIELAAEDFSLNGSTHVVGEYSKGLAIAQCRCNADCCLCANDGAV